MNRGPDLNPQEQKSLDKMVELEIDSFIEQQHIHEVPIICEGNDIGIDE